MKTKEITNILRRRAYILTMYSPYYDYNSDTEEEEKKEKNITGFNREGHATSSSTKKLIAVARLLEIKCWELHSQDRNGFRNEKIAESPVMRRYRLTKKRAEEEQHIKTERLVERLNALPEIKTIKDEDTDTVLVTFTRQIAQYNRTSSRYNNIIHPNIIITYCNRKRTDWKGVHEFIKKDGGIMLKKFAEEMPRLFGKENCHYLEPKPLLKDIRKEYYKFAKEIREVSNE